MGMVYVSGKIIGYGHEAAGDRRAYPTNIGFERVNPSQIQMSCQLSAVRQMTADNVYLAVHSWSIL